MLDGYTAITFDTAKLDSICEGTDPPCFEAVLGDRSKNYFAAPRDGAYYFFGSCTAVDPNYGQVNGGSYVEVTAIIRDSTGLVEKDRREFSSAVKGPGFHNSQYAPRVLNFNFAVDLLAKETVALYHMYGGISTGSENPGGAKGWPIEFWGMVLDDDV